MFAGILNKKIYIYRSVNTKNDFGEEVEAYYEYSSTRAGVSHQSTSRTVINSEIQYPYTKFFVIRKYVDLTENDLIKFDIPYAKQTVERTDNTVPEDFFDPICDVLLEMFKNRLGKTLINANGQAVSHRLDMTSTKKRSL